jgi:hypothetical protein
MAVLDITRTQLTLAKNHTILAALTQGVAQPRAALAPAAGDWSALFVACHLLDYERIFARRVDAILTQDAPLVEPMDHLALVSSNDYAGQAFDATLTALVAERQTLLARLKALDATAWSRTGAHPEFGPAPLLHFCANACMHDINHIEQIVRCLA